MAREKKYDYKVTVQITPETMLDYNMFRLTANSGMIFPIIAGLYFIWTFYNNMHKQSTGYLVLYLFLAFMFIGGPFLNQLLRSWRSTRPGSSILRPVDYYLDEEGIYPEGNEDRKILWDQLYHIVSTKKNMIIYANRKLAFFIPKADMGDAYPQIRETIMERVDPRRYDFKKDGIKQPIEKG